MDAAKRKTQLRMTQINGQKDVNILFNFCFEINLETTHACEQWMFFVTYVSSECFINKLRRI